MLKLSIIKVCASLCTVYRYYAANIQSMSRTEFELTKPIFIVCLCFVVCVFPLAIAEFVGEWVSSDGISSSYWAHYSVNFIIYASRNTQCQNALNDLFCMVFCILDSHNFARVVNYTQLIPPEIPQSA